MNSIFLNFQFRFGVKIWGICFKHQLVASLGNWAVVKFDKIVCFFPVRFGSNVQVGVWAHTSCRCSCADLKSQSVWLAAYSFLLTMKMVTASKQDLFLVLVWALLISCSLGSIYPEGEDKAAWDARINANIDKLHKRDVTLSIALTSDEVSKILGGKLRLRVNQTKTPIPLGKFTTSWTNSWSNYTQLIFINVILQCFGIAQLNMSHKRFGLSIWRNHKKIIFD